MERYYKVYFYSRSSPHELFVETITVRVGDDIFEEANKLKRTRYYIGSIFEFLLPSIENCRACQEEQPNQLAHMEPGGCLYSPE